MTKAVAALAWLAGVLTSCDGGQGSKGTALVAVQETRAEVPLAFAASDEAGNLVGTTGEDPTNKLYLEKPSGEYRLVDMPQPGCWNLVWPGPPGTAYVPCTASSSGETGFNLFFFNGTDFVPAGGPLLDGAADRQGRFFAYRDDATRELLAYQGATPTVIGTVPFVAGHGCGGMGAAGPQDLWLKCGRGRMWTGLYEPYLMHFNGAGFDAPVLLPSRDKGGFDSRMTVVGNEAFIVEFSDYEVAAAMWSFRADGSSSRIVSDTLLKVAGTAADDLWFLAKVGSCKGTPIGALVADRFCEGFDFAGAVARKNGETWTFYRLPTGGSVDLGSLVARGRDTAMVVSGFMRASYPP
jgi:hypothetical protein